MTQHPSHRITTEAARVISQIQVSFELTFEEGNKRIGELKEAIQHMAQIIGMNQEEL
ncbi:MAG: hypothetical protein F6K14_21520, partial [Symploca sp. SIO2C1]|nr:hypothetical protein [Symploca sp. SIO2C1]